MKEGLQLFCRPSVIIFYRYGVYMQKVRLDKYLADAGQGTRSQVKDLVKAGQVTVNGTVIKKSDIKVSVEDDVIAVSGKKLNYSQFEFYMLNKPAGVVSATVDKTDKTVIELINEDKRRDLFPVGRLDKDTEGLLIITNDGKLANNLLAPGKHVPKQYYVEVDGEITSEHISIFAEGIDIGDEELTAPAILELLDTECFCKAHITITEGRYHQIKRMFGSIGMKVTYLKRISMGPLVLDDTLAVGQYRRLTDEEINLLKEVHCHG